VDIETATVEREWIPCPCCKQDGGCEPWAEENGYVAVKCNRCGLVYVNPRPSASLISEAIKTGVHRDVAHSRTAIAHRSASNVRLYRRLLSRALPDVWAAGRPIAWLDIGAGYGEVVEALTMLAPVGSRVEGIEPMTPKVAACKKRGLSVREAYLSSIDDQYDFVSLINVFSHVPEFHDFLREIKVVMRPNGEFLMETGNIGDLASVRHAPTELDLPDHLVFAGEYTIGRYLENAGFEIVGIWRRRRDTIFNALKNCARKLRGYQVTLAAPYTSPYRSLLIRARLGAR
jgi:SAM-dependent methyltransferase